MKTAKIETGYWPPRWIHQKGINVPLTWNDAEAHPSTFINETMHRMRLVALSFTADWRDPGQDYPNHPNWANRVLVDIGKSGRSDMNAVPASISALCATPQPRRPRVLGYLGSSYTYDYPGVETRLPRPFRLPRDQGLEVKLSHLDPAAAAIDDSPRLTFIARGTREDGQHAILAGEVASLGRDDPAVILDSSDLYNNGEQDVFIKTLAVKSKLKAMTGSLELDKRWNGFLSNLGITINPTCGTAWMPNDDTIPIGNVMPMSSVHDPSDVGPRAYLFPRDTWLEPTQAISVRLYRQDTLEDTSTLHKINVCMFGELEVR